MSPITHLRVGWTVANSADLNRRERAMVTAAGVIPDLDGFGIIAELLTKNSSKPLLWWSGYHHVLGHNLGFCLFCVFLALFFTKQRMKVGLLVFLSFYLHLICDVIGAKGPDGEQWSIPYFLPFSDSWRVTWEHQWGVNAWPNVLLTAVLILPSVFLTIRREFSLLGLISTKADRAVVKTLRDRFPSKVPNRTEH